MENKLTMKPVFAKDDPRAIIPTKNVEDAGYDLYAIFEEPLVVHKSCEVIMFNTGLRSAFDAHYFADIKERGSTGTRNMGQRAGVVEGNYRGVWFAPITNHSSHDIYYYSEESDIMKGLTLRLRERWADQIKEGGLTIAFDLEKETVYEKWTFGMTDAYTLARDEDGRPTHVESSIDDSYSSPNVRVEAIVYPQSKAIAQFVITKKEDWVWGDISVEELMKIESKRGEGKLGSSGK